MTPGMQSLTLEADYKNLPPGKVAISEPDALVLGLKTGSLCTISDETGMQLGGAKSLLDLDVPPGHFFMEADTSKMMGIEPGFRYTLEPVPDPFTQPLEKLVLEVSSASPKADTAYGAIHDHVKVKEFLHGRVIHLGMRLRWREYGFYLTVKDTIPKMAPGQYLVFEDAGELELQTASPFNGIILIDSSPTMLEKDIRVLSEMKPMLAPLYLLAETALPELEPLLQKVESDGSISRRESALLGIFLFVAEKMERGLCEKISLIEYGQDGRFIGPDVADGMEPFFRISTAGPVGFKGAEEVGLKKGALLSDEPPSRAGTNIEIAIERALEAFNRMNVHETLIGGNPKPAVIILVSEGKYSDGRSPALVVEEKIAPVETLVLQTISIGKASDQDLLARCAELGRGNHTNTRSFEDIIRYFSSKARTFGTSCMTGKAAPAGSLAETKALEACPKCGREDFFRSFEMKDGTAVQVVVCSVCGFREEKLSL